MNISKNIVKAFDNISKIKKADIDALQKVEGIGEKRAHAIIRNIQTIKKRMRFR